jgi:hypothetical protein
MAEKMREGWLWFDNDQSRTVEEKVRRAAERYREKFGRVPNTCYVHPQAIDDKELQCGSGRVTSYCTISGWALRPVTGSLCQQGLRLDRWRGTVLNCSGRPSSLLEFPQSADASSRITTPRFSSVA